MLYTILLRADIILPSIYIKVYQEVSLLQFLRFKYFKKFPFLPCLSRDIPILSYLLNFPVYIRWWIQNLKFLSLEIYSASF